MYHITPLHLLTYFPCNAADDDDLSLFAGEEVRQCGFRQRDLPEDVELKQVPIHRHVSVLDKRALTATSVVHQDVKLRKK